MSKTSNVLLALVCAGAAVAYFKREEVVPIVAAFADRVAQTAPGLAPIANAVASAVKPYGPAQPSEAKSPQGVAAAPALAPGGARPKGPSVPVRVAKVEKRNIPVTIEAVGTVQAIAAIPLKPRVDSIVEKLHVSEGSAVKAGDLIFTLDSRSIRAQLAQSDATIEKDAAQIAQARLDADRADDLFTKRFGTEVNRNTTATNLKALEAQLAADKANRELLATQLTFCEIRAPVSGRIGSIIAKAGWFARQADLIPMATVNQLDPVFVVFALPQTAFESLQAARAQRPVRVVAKAQGAEITGQIAFVENQIDITTGTIQVKAQMANTDEKLWPGAFVPVNVILRDDPDAIAVINDAVQIGQQGPYVFIAKEGGTAEIRPITIARKVGTQSVVSKGLAEGETIIVDGVMRLVNGASIEINKTPSGGPAGKPLADKPAEAKAPDMKTGDAKPASAPIVEGDASATKGSPVDAKSKDPAKVAPKG